MIFFIKKTHFGSKKVYLRDSQNRLGIGFLADSENPSDHFFLKFRFFFTLGGVGDYYELAFE